MNLSAEQQIIKTVRVAGVPHRAMQSGRGGSWGGQPGLAQAGSVSQGSSQDFIQMCLGGGVQCDQIIC
jgi:hypothetical protein